MLLEIQESIGVTPSGLKNRPDVQEQDLPYLDSFRLLTRSREYGQSGPQPIRLTEIKAYLDMVGEDRVEERMKLLRIVQEMDHTYLEFAAKQSTTNQ